MNYGQLRTAWDRAMRDLVSDDTTRFDFGIRFDEAQLELAGALPPFLVQEMVGIFSYSSIAPAEWYEIYSLAMDVMGVSAVVDDSGEWRPCRYVTPSAFNDFGSLTDDPIYTSMNGRIYVSPTPEANQTGGSELRLVFLRKPTTYLRSAAQNVGLGALVKGSVANTNARRMVLSDPATFTLPLSVYSGAHAVFAVSDGADFADFRDTLTTEVISIEQEGDDLVLYTKDDFPLDFSPLEFAGALAVVTTGSASLVTAGDSESPSPWPEKWHPILLDFALSKEFAIRGDVQRAALYAGRVNQALAMLGVTMKVGDEGR